VSALGVLLACTVSQFRPVTSAQLDTYELIPVWRSSCIGVRQHICHVVDQLVMKTPARAFAIDF
jgi:hypothetical protein